MTALEAKQKFEVAEEARELARAQEAQRLLDEFEDWKVTIWPGLLQENLAKFDQDIENAISHGWNRIHYKLMRDYDKNLNPVNKHIDGHMRDHFYKAIEDNGFTVMYMGYYDFWYYTVSF